MARRITPAVMEGFVAEVRSYLPRIHRGLDALQQEPFQLDALNEMHRLLHSIKGTASMVELTEISLTAGDAEQRMEQALLGQEVLDARGQREVRAAAHRIGRLLDAAVVVPQESRVAGVAQDPPVVVDAELAATIAEEFGGYLDQISTWLRSLEVGSESSSAWSEVWRPIHTLKGTAGIVGLMEVSQLAHRMEDLLTSLDRGEQTLDEDCLALLFRTTDTLVDLVAGEPVEGAMGQRLVEIYRTFADKLDGDPKSDPQSREEEVAAPRLRPVGDLRSDAIRAREASDVPSQLEIGDVTSSGNQGLKPMAAQAAVSAPAGPIPSESLLRVRTDRLDGILRLVGDVTLQRNAFDQQVGRLAELRNELQLNLRRLSRIGRQLEAELDSTGFAPSVPEPMDGAAAEFDSLEMDRYTALDRLARQLEEATSDSSAVGSGFEMLLREIEGFQSRLGVLSRDMQERLAQLRTVPFESLSGRLHRTVRTTAERRGKLVSLIVRNENIELDKDVIDGIVEPLLHLLRNAVDHGIESPERRIALGKPERGQVVIEVVQEGGEGVIRIRDDGRGIDLELIRERAVEAGVLSGDEVRSASDEQLRKLLFRRGFSTASELSEVSGRGVGLDVALASIERLRGFLEVESVPGQGTEFTVRLPSSQSILRVLLVSSGGEAVAVPLVSVERVEAMSTSDLTVGEDGLVLKIGESSIQALELERTLGLPSRTDLGVQRIPAIVVRIGDRRLVLLAERILGVQETVMRPMSDLFSHRLHGFSGAALTGDGQVVLVLNTSDLTREAPAQVDRSVSRAPQAHEVLIVDDSLSVRQVLSRMVERHGWRPSVARDGEDALEILQGAARIPDVAIVDLEMPRMDGFELTRALQANPIYKRMPIVILTTRAGQKHRQKAFDLGVTDYLVKPYREDILLRSIEAAVNGTEVPR